VELNKHQIEAKKRAQGHTVGIFKQYQKEEVFVATAITHLDQHAQEKLTAPFSPTTTKEHTWKMEVPLLSFPGSQDAKSRTTLYSQSNG